MEDPGAWRWAGSQDVLRSGSRSRSRSRSGIGSAWLGLPSRYGRAKKKHERVPWQLFVLAERGEKKKTTTAQQRAPRRLKRPLSLAAGHSCQFAKFPIWISKNHRPQRDAALPFWPGETA
ncbi:hypothetical protein L1887_62725 [Cichorium endivia]|nr:hypothetical protein L1887_62725 [Cichorium endivia]